MKNPFQKGDIKIFETRVDKNDIASFQGSIVHEVYSTFALARDAEWACRLFVLEMKEEDEEGIGVRLCIDHLSPAFIGAKVRIIAKLEKVEKNNVVCTFEAFSKDQVIARGEQVQKILKKKKIKAIFNNG